LLRQRRGGHVYAYAMTLMLLRLFWRSRTIRRVEDERRMLLLLMLRNRSISSSWRGVIVGPVARSLAHCPHSRLRRFIKIPGVRSLVHRPHIWLRTRVIAPVRHRWSTMVVLMLANHLRPQNSLSPCRFFVSLL